MTTYAGAGFAHAGAPSNGAQEFEDAAQTFEASYSLTVSELKAAIRRAIAANRPLMIWSSPGLGKSSANQQVAVEDVMRYIDLRALLLDPVDLRGLPHLDRERNTMVWARPDFLPRPDSTEQWLINIEELPAALPSVQTALYQLMLDRKLGEYELPPGAHIVACGNRANDRGVFHQLPAALINRFFQVDLEVSVKEWTTWAFNNDLSPEVIVFIQYHPGLLLDYDPKNVGYAFPSPRSWEYVSDLVKSAGSGDVILDKKVERAMIRGAVGPAAGAQFLSFLSVGKGLPLPQTVLSQPDDCMVPSSVDQQMVLCASLSRFVNDMNFDAAVKYAKRLTPEVGEHLVSNCLAQHPELQASLAYIEWESYKN